MAKTMNLMVLMRRFSIRARMHLAVASVIVLLVLVGGLGLAAMFRVEALGMSFLDSSLARNGALTAVRDQMALIRRHEKDMIINYEKPAEVSRFYQAWKTSHGTLRARLTDLRGALGGTDDAVLAKLDGALTAYADAFAPVARQLEANAYDTATVANRLMGKAYGAYAEAEQQVALLDASAIDSARQTRESTARSTRMTFLAFAAGVLGLIVVMVPLALVNSRSICRPLDTAREVARRIAGGDLTQEIGTDGSDETAQLLQALSDMQGSLRHIARQLHSASDSVATAASEIATGTLDLSVRTEQAASSLEETSSAMEELTANVRESADSSRHASDLAGSAAHVAARGGQVVADVVSTMDRINADSKRIANIVEVIDGIAFQTNILALNAAVEAARAGDQGRGFAVVASEVRSLAQRSAQAAREIKDLIGASVAKVEEGALLVKDAGATMQNIVSSVQSVVTIVGEMASGAARQTSGMAQISEAVTRLDHMTQQNAALVEESAAASESLKDQAALLGAVVDGFRLPDGGDGAPSSNADMAESPSNPHAEFPG